MTYDWKMNLKRTNQLQDSDKSIPSVFQLSYERIAAVFFGR
ncbi:MULTISPECIES: hypothetical protein [Bacillus]|nr:MULTISPECIES: hypothetical protein [Bacillus]